MKEKKGTKMIAATFTDRQCNLLSLDLEIGITKGRCVLNKK
jgi:hypothetical protein